ncbi:hypothetical protein PSMA106859_10010 [Pseudoalteromonas maricaloris]
MLFLPMLAKSLKSLMTPNAIFTYAGKVRLKSTETLEEYGQKRFSVGQFLAPKRISASKPGYRARQRAVNTAVRNSSVENVSFAKPTSARSLLGLSVVVFEVFRNKRLLFALFQQHRGIPEKIAW